MNPSQTLHKHFSTPGMGGSSPINKLAGWNLYIIWFGCNNDVIVECSWHTDKSLIRLLAEPVGLQIDAG